ncbi:hypothetical protein [Candidatus Uabimicrobium sp. HlEnr_7]|uniref:hypothetical protein n=1 Tax=Candidatus Uabimicrobium helgolandensis TaxID=3095367 RepID=UPI00355856E7
MIDINNSKLKKIKFSQINPGCDRKYFINEDDIRTVLSRIPYENWQMLKAVHLNDKGQGVRILGYVTQGRREIALCALPPRVSLTRFLLKHQAPAMFGAKRGEQWNKIAIRRYLLYDVFLHELGHLQIVDENAKSIRRKFASETIAQEFADYWREFLWQQDFSHPDPVHNPPQNKIEVSNNTR